MLPGLHGGAFAPSLASVDYDRCAGVVVEAEATRCFVVAPTVAGDRQENYGWGEVSKARGGQTPVRRVRFHRVDVGEGHLHPLVAVR